MERISAMKLEKGISAMKRRTDAIYVLLKGQASTTGPMWQPTIRREVMRQAKEISYSAILDDYPGRGSGNDSGAAYILPDI